MTQALSIATWNIHKGFSQFNRRMTVHELRERLRELSADIVFLQEVQGLHLGHAERHSAWPSLPQHEFLAEGVWDNHSYGRNMVYDHGHHGNAILSRFPILHEYNQDVTHLRFEKRCIARSTCRRWGGRCTVFACICPCSRVRGGGRWMRWRGASRRWCRRMRRC
jgi:endonuclease/exonuclease/phosphatase family metal-dependent hydrolase